MNEILHKSQRNFIQHIIDKDIQLIERQKKVITRFPPEPNGHLHLGHAKSICLNFGLAKEYDGICNLRFDDTNPSTENEEYVNSINDDVEWLGFGVSNETYYASDYFSKLFDFACGLIQKGKAFVDSQPPETIRSQRGSLQTQPTATRACR